MPTRWIMAVESPERAPLARALGVAPVVAQILINRGLKEPDAAAFLAPRIGDLLAPELLPGADRAAQLIVDAVRAKRRIVLYGDYDVDGTTGTAILWHILRAAGTVATCYVPHRVEEGYGLNTAAVQKLLAGGAEVIISIDCGITAVDVAETVRAAGAQLIITDHHAPDERIPVAAAIVHPTVGGVCPNEHVCGAGVAFKLAWAVAKRLSGGPRVGPVFRDLLVELLPLAALGTVADVVPLVGENRIIAKHGLTALRDTKLPGLRALVDSVGLRGGRIDAGDVGFRIGPRINAAGRMGHAGLVVELFTVADHARGQEITHYLDEHNRHRQATERRIVDQAVERIERDRLASAARRGIVLASRDWHAGVIGIVAARIVDRYHRPTVLIALSDDDGQGSARSIRHFDLHDAIGRCREHLLSFGGHAMAAGLRIAPSNVDAFADAFVAEANRRLTGADMAPSLHLDAEVSLDALTLSTVEEIASLGPFGAGNPKPRLATDWVDVAAEPRCVGRDGSHLQVRLQEHGTQIKAIGFGLARVIEDLKEFRRCRVAFEPIINDFNGRRSVEMQIIDLKTPADRQTPDAGTLDASVRDAAGAHAPPAPTA